MGKPSIMTGPSGEKPALGYDPTTNHAPVILKVVSVTQDPTTGQWYGVLDVNASFSASSLAINDVNTPAHTLLINSDGSVNVNASITPAANQRVNAQANDFLTGSIVDLTTLLTLAGTPTDANTVNSLMGRLTKIRDLLSATIAVSGTFWQATQPVSAASLPLPTGAAKESGGNLDSIKSDLDTIATQTATPNVSDRWARQLGQIDIARVLGAAISNTNPVPAQDIEQSGYTALTTPQASTNAGSETLYTFSSQVNRVVLQNNTTANVMYAFDAAASAGSLVLAPGQTLIYPKKVTVVHLYTAAALNVNGNSAGNIVLLGAL